MDWSYMKLILFQIGLSPDLVELIMSAVTTTWFVVLINRVPMDFFKGSRGIWQGFPLSLYLFILVVEVLILLIKHAKNQSLFQG